MKILGSTLALALEGCLLDLFFYLVFSFPFLLSLLLCYMFGKPAIPSVSSSAELLGRGLGVGRGPGGSSLDEVGYGVPETHC